LKFFSKEKPTKRDDDPGDTAGRSTESEIAAEQPDEAADTVFAPKCESDFFRTPVSALAQKLGIKAMGGKAGEDFFLYGCGALPEAQIFWSILNKKAADLLEQMSTASELSENGERASETVTFSSDMYLETYIANNQMKAYACIIPPVGSGIKPDFDRFYTGLTNAGINSGVNIELLKELFENDTVLRIFTVAEGKAVIDGEDGKIIELFAREKKISFESDENDLVDYKNLNWLQPIHGGEIICKIIPPVPEEDGVNVRGVVQKARVGKVPKPPIGKNTGENEEHTALIALCDGQLKYSGGLFNVEQMIRIDGDVDSSIGNLDVIGSVTINGNVFEGFTVKASEDIVVRGSVAGSELIAGGSIQVFQGINGSYKGKLDAGGNVTSKYLENCHVVAGAIVKADSIVNSKVISSDKVVVTSGKGIILGSTIIGFRGIEAKTIGNEQNIPTSLTIGTDPKLYDELHKLKIEVQELSHKSEENDKNINYLEERESLDSKYQQLLGKLKFDQKIYYLNLSKKSGRISAIELELKSGEACQIILSHLYPTVNVTIGNTKLIIDYEKQMCRIFKSEGEIIIGSK